MVKPSNFTHAPCKIHLPLPPIPPGPQITPRSQSPAPRGLTLLRAAGVAGAASATAGHGAGRPVPCPARCRRAASGARPSCTCPAAGRGSEGCAGAGAGGEEVAGGPAGGGAAAEVAVEGGAPGETGESCGTCSQGSWSEGGEGLERERERERGTAVRAAGRATIALPARGQPLLHTHPSEILTEHSSPLKTIPTLATFTNPYLPTSSAQPQHGCIPAATICLQQPPCPALTSPLRPRSAPGIPGTFRDTQHKNWSTASLLVPAAQARCQPQTLPS